MSLTTVGTDAVTSLSRRHIMPEIVDNFYRSSPILFRINKANKRIVQGGTHIEVPMMYKGFASGGPYQGLELLDVSPSDTVKNGAWAWKQQYVTVTIDGLTLIKTESPEAIAKFVRFYFQQAEEEMIKNLSTGLWSDGSNPKQVDGLEAAVDDGTVATTYANLSRATNTWLNSQVDAVTAALGLSALQSIFMKGVEGGRHPTIIASRSEQYNRFHALNIINQRYPVGASGHDEQLASAGFTNLAFNGVPWVVDSFVFDGPNASNSAIVGLNEDYIYWAVSPLADFYLEDFQRTVNQDGMVAKILWAGNLVVTNTQRQFKMTNVSA